MAALNKTVVNSMTSIEVLPSRPFGLTQNEAIEHLRARGEWPTRVSQSPEEASSDYHVLCAFQDSFQNEEQYQAHLEHYIGC
jgi:hypothetical protein